jgi:hypothetical protein
MSSNTSLQTTGTGPSTGGSSNASTGAKKTAAELVAALQKARATKAAADKAAADKAAADKAAADAQAADSCAAAWKISVARGNARAAAQAAAESRAAAKLVLRQQRITEAADARAAAAAAAKAAREAAYKVAHDEWKRKLQKDKEELDACAHCTGSYAKYCEAIPYARLGPDFDQLWSECESSDNDVADSAKALKELVDKYKRLLAEKAKSVEDLKAQEPEHPDVVFKREFLMFFENHSKLRNLLFALLEGKTGFSTKFVAAGIDPNFFCMFGALFVLSSQDDTVSLDLSQLHPYDKSKDKLNLGRSAFHLWCLQHTIFGFIQNRLVPLVDPSSGLTLEVLLLNYKYILPMHIHDRDAQIAEHSANIQATVEFHRQKKEQKRCKNREATKEEFEEHFRACEEHSRQEAAEAAKSRELANSVKFFLRDPVNEALLSNLKSFGIHDNDAAWNNSTSSTHSLKNFLAQNNLLTFKDAIGFLQGAGIIADEPSTIPTRKNAIRQAFSFIFRNDEKSSDSEDLGDLASSLESSKSEEAKSPSNSNDSAKEQKSSKKTLRIIRGEDEYAILARVINDAEAEAEKKPLASKESSKAEDSSANEQTEAKLLLPSPPAPSFPSRSQFVLSPEDAKAIGSENGIEPETVLMVVMMKGVQSISAASGPDVIKAAKHIEAQIATEEKAAEEKAAKEAAEKFKEEKRADILARLAQRRSGSVGGGASASADVVSSIEGDIPLTPMQRFALAKAKRDEKISAQAAAAASSQGTEFVEVILNQSNPILEQAASFLPPKKQ